VRRGDTKETVLEEAFPAAGAFETITWKAHF
jgi:hypothetical protein